MKFSIFSKFPFLSLPVIMSEFCKYSKNADKLCAFARKYDDELECGAILNWFDDLRVKNLDGCFMRWHIRKKLAWTNKMKKKFTRQ